MKQLYLCTLCILLAACANKGGYVQFHNGESLHPSLKAIVEGHYGYRDGSLANEMTRIVEINGIQLPREWGVAEGANTVSLLPGKYDIKVLYVHGEEHIDYYSYTTIPAILNENCTYKVITSWSSLENTMVYDLVGKPSTASGNTDCGYPIIPDREEGVRI